MTRGLGISEDRAVNDERKSKSDGKMMNGYNRQGGANNNNNLDSSSSGGSMSTAISENFNALLRRVSNEREREQRLEACGDLRRTILEAGEFKALNREPFSVLRQFDEMIHTRMNIDVRKEIAKCMGAMGYIMGHKIKDYLQWLFENYERTNVVEAKALYMNALAATYAADGRRRMEKLTPKILSDLQKSLERIESSQVLVAILGTIVSISAIYPDAFSPHFKDIVDIVVGWYVDTEQENGTLIKCGEALSKLQSFWLHDMEFTLSLLTHFLEDAETYVEDMRSNVTKKRSESLEATDYLRKSAALIKAFKTVLSAISEYFFVTSENEAYCRFVDEAVAKLTYCVESCAGKGMSGFSTLVDAALDSLKLLLDVCRMAPEKILKPASVTCTKLMELGDLDDSSSLAMISLVKKVVTQLPSDLVAAYISSFIGPSGCIFKLRSHSNQDVAREALAVYKQLLVPRGVKCLQEVYRYILGELVYSIKVMHKATESIESLTLPTVPDNNPWPEDELDYAPVLAEAVVVYLSSALIELASAKSSVIGMWALSPSLFQLLTTELPVATSWMSSYYPAAQYSLLATLKMHCDKHDHFIANSDLLTEGSPSSMLTFAQSAKHFEAIVNVLVKVLEEKRGNEILALAMRWTKDLVEAVIRSGSAGIFRQALFHRLVNAFLNGARGTVKVDFASCVAIIAKHARRWFTAEIFQRYVRTVTQVTSETMDKSMLNQLAEIPIWELMAMDLEQSTVVARRRPNAEWIVASVNFENPYFKSIIDFLLYDVSLLDDENASCPWTDCLTMMYVNCTRKSLRDKSPQSIPSYLWHYMIWQAGLFCVNARLKTSLGKPQETFLAIEGELKALANEITKTESEPSYAASLKPTKFSSWFRVRTFLNFVEILEKAMYNAYEGTAFALPAVAKPVKAFFRTNKGTCVEWLSRIRIAVMTVAFQNGSYSMVVRLGCTALRDLESVGPKAATSNTAERLLLLICKAMLALNCSSSLTGLYAWAKKHLHLKLPWIRLAAEQAAEKYETASAGYETFLAPTESSKDENGDGDNATANPVSSGVGKFCADALIDCYASLNDFKSAREWMEKMAIDNKEWANHSTASLVAVQEKLASGQLDDARTTWRERGTALGPKLIWGLTDCQDYFEAKCLDAAFQTEDGARRLIMRKTTDELNEFQSMNLCSSWPERVSREGEFRRQYFRIVNDPDVIPIDTIQIGENSKNLRLRELTDLQQKLRIRECLFPAEGSISAELYLPLSYMARKLSNYTCSGHCLARYAGLDNEAAMSAYLSTIGAPGDIKKLLAGYHTSKLTFAVSDRKPAFVLLCNTVSNFLDGCAPNVMAQYQQQQPNSVVMPSITDLLSKSLAPVLDVGRANKSAGSPISSGSPLSSPMIGNSNPGIIVSKCLATLANWLEQDSSFGEVLLANEETFFIQLVEQELQLTERIVGALDADCVVGSLLSLSTRLCPSNSKSEALLADWAYKTARKFIEGSSRDEHVKLMESDIAIIEAACQEESPATKEAVISLLSTLRSDDGSVESESELRKELASLSVSLSLSADSLIPIWQNANYRIFLLYGVAADTYLKMLHTTEQKPSAAITAALRLLRLLVKHYSDLQHFITGDFASIHAQAWKDIIPQLFARLNHPSPAVRNVISATLCQIADSHPEMIAFPAVVGSMSAGINKRQDSAPDFFAATTDDVLDELGSENTNTLLDLATRTEENLVEDSVMNDAYSMVVNALRAKNAPMVDDIKTFISELQRITLLREEVWLMALSHMEPEVTKRLAHLREDIQTTERHPALSDAEKELIIAEKRDIVSKMIFQTLTDLFEATSAEPETENERQFSVMFCPIINSALSKLANNRMPEEIWAPFAKLLHTLYNRSKPALDMNDISPVLAKLRSSRVPMPGIDDKSVSIESICVEVTVLPTKTRPKKLRFIGSDGNRYTYLFKGLEDLHLDERMMQFLGVCNTFFDPRKSQERCNYLARNYSVTPLGHRSGLIQWVENATPVFSLYKRWQMREASLNPGQTAVTRPSDLFRKKLEPLLHRRNIFDLQNRQKWPASVLRDVLTELVAETPRDLLQKEFWCLSNDADGWWRVTQQFARSTAVMSVIGHVIGLGDRHLDNLLVDLHTGEIIHIDYNVCFEKGTHLRVPERVPFRMTPNLKAALGPTGVEGTFRMACEETMRFLRQGGEALLTLLEAFVYDPLVDWTTTHETGVANFLGHNVLFTVYGSSRLQKYAELGHQLAYRLFIVRVREIATAWLRNKDILLATLQMYRDKSNGNNADLLDPTTIEAERHLALTDHHKMMLEVRSLIKSLAKYEDGNESREHVFTDYILAYKNFSESLTSFLKTPDASEGAGVTLDDMTTLVHRVYDGLLFLATIPQGAHGIGGKPGESNKKNGPMNADDAFSTETPKRNVNHRKQRRREGRNIHALNVWRRVKVKLEGREPDATKRCSISEQVDFIIRESTSVDNLALMYEGWTAWV